MKQFLLLSLLIGLQALAQAQGDCASMLADATAARDRRDYITAVQKYNAVRKCDPAQEREANREILRIFEKLKQLKDEADKARALADIKTEQAETAKKDAQTAKERAEQSDRIGKNAVVAMRAARTDPVVGLSMAQFLMRKYPSAFVASAVFNDIFAKTDQFYQNRFSPFGGTPLNALAFSPDGQNLLIGAGYGQAALFSLNGQKVQTYAGLGEEGADAGFLNDGKRVLMSAYRTAKIWDTYTGKVLYSFFGIKTAAASSDGRYFALADEKGHITLRSSLDTLLLFQFDTDKASISKVAVSPDLKSIVTVSDTTKVLLWSPEGILKATLKGHTDEVWSACFSPGGDLILTGSDDNTARIWSLDGKPQAELSGHTNDVYWASFSNDGRYVFTASEDNTVRQWDLKGGLVAEFKGHAKTVKRVACAPSGNLVASVGDDGTCLLWQVNNLSRNFDQNASKTLKHSRQLPPRGSVRGFLYSLSHDGRTVLACNNDSVRIANLYDTEPGKVFSVHENPMSISLSPDLNTVVTGHSNGALLRWNAKNRTFIDSLKGHTGYIAYIVFSKDGRTFATASWDKTARIWDASNGALKVALIGHTDRVESVAISREGLVLTGSRDGTAKLWSKDGKEMRTIAGHTRNLSCMAFAPDGQTFITGSWDKTARIWDLEGREKAVLEGHLEEITSVAFAPDGKSVLTGSIDNSVRMWTPQGEEIIKLNGHKTDVSALAYTTDSSIVSADRRGEVFSWYTIERFIAGQLAEVSELQMVKQGLELSDGEISSSKDPDLLIYSAELRAKKQQWKEATDLYEKAYQLKPSHKAILGIYKGCEQLNQKFDFSRFLAADDAGSLTLFGQTLFGEKKHLEEAVKLLEKSERIAHDPQNLKLLNQIAAYTNQSFDFDRFLRSDKAEELESYGDYFSYDLGATEQAAQLYAKAEAIQHGTQRLIKLHRTSTALNRPFGFERFMSSDSLEELSQYARYFYGRSKWDESWQLYEKTLSKKHLSYNLLQMQRIAKKTGRTLDFNLFLQSKNPTEVAEFANYFYREAQEAEYLRPDKLPASDSLLAVERAQWNKAQQLYGQLYALRPTPSNLTRWHKTSKKAGQELDFSRFTASTVPSELNEYADYFYNTKELGKAQRLYQKSDSIHRSTTTLAGLYTVARESGQKSDLDKMFREMLRSGKPDELLEYATAARPTAEMTSNKIPLETFYLHTKQLEDKAFSLDPVEAVQLKKDLANTYNSLGWDQLFVPDSIGTGPKGCELSMLRGIELDPSNIYLYTNLPTTYLLQNRWREAEKIYLERKDLPYIPARNLPYYRDVFIKDIKELEQKNITHPGFECVRQVLKDGKPLPDDKPCKRQ